MPSPNDSLHTSHTAAPAAPVSSAASASPADPTSQERAHGIARARGVDQVRNPNPPLHVVFDQPMIPPNTGNAIRMCAGAGAHLHLCEPLGFTLEEKHLRRAGLDYHDLADVTVHPSLDACLTSLGVARTSDGVDSSDPGAGSAANSTAAGNSAEPAEPAEPRRVFAFTAHTSTNFADIRYRWGDVLVFGCEPTGLDAEALADPRITAKVRIPMLPGRRSMNLSNAAAVATYEAWRQLGFPGAAEAAD